MANQIRSGVVKQLRDERGWTQDDLAKRAGLNKQSISRIENGESRGARQETIDLLCKAFEVDRVALTGKPSNPPAPEGDSSDPYGTASQLNLRIDNAARNALVLIARRYGIQLSEIVEIAPFLFFLAAERSLQWRRERLNETDNAIREVERRRDEYPYLPIDMPGNDDLMCCESDSIQQNDIFGRLYEDANIRRSFRRGRDFDHNVGNQFAVFLTEELKKLQAATPEGSSKSIRATFDGWHPDVWSTPQYQICLDEAVAMVGSDEEAVHAVLRGTAPLHEIPKDLKSSTAEKLGEWAKAKAKEHTSQILDQL